MTYLGIAFTITTYVTFEGHKLWGFDVPSFHKGQRPCWSTKKEAVESAQFHLNLWSKGR